ncbi:hypothetical protein GCM10028808_00380 [Spirosoma migulaei]
MNVVKGIRKAIGRWVLVPLTKQYLSKDRYVQIVNIHLKVPTGVFHPTLFFSTKFLLDYINSQVVSQASVLELGAGSGLLSIVLAKKGALVTASDISAIACKTVAYNATVNDVSIEIIESDVFDDFANQSFDLIVINPPYYPINPNTEAEKAWYCGVDYDYFHKLFGQLAAFMAKDGFAVMVLSEDCNSKLISQLAIKYGYEWAEIRRKRFRFEWNYIFKIKHTN